MADMSGKKVCLEEYAVIVMTLVLFRSIDILVHQDAGCGGETNACV